VPSTIPGRRSAVEDAFDDTIWWLADNPGALNAYQNEWVAVVGRKVVAHGPSVNDVVRAAARRGHADPLLVPVSAADAVFV